MKQKPDRTLKVAENLKRAIANIIIEEEIFIENTYITISNILPSKDFGFVKVYFRTTQSKHKDIIEKLLTSFSAKWGFKLMKTLRLSKNPHLVFFYDDTFEVGEEIKQILENIDKDL